MSLIDEITFFLEGEGFRCSRQMKGGFETICTSTLSGKDVRVILPLEISALSEDDAMISSQAAERCVADICRADGYPVIITEDRWNLQGEVIKGRLLAHLEKFSQAYARNCEVRRIDKTMAREFLQVNHSYGYAACKYCYGLFLKRQTGHLASELFVPGTLIAVAAFSNARKWIKGEQVIRSYEWTRFASLPGLRVSGAMGKMLKVFMDEVCPDDIMSYADLEWSEGDVYERLGFKSEGRKEPVMFAVDTNTWERIPVKSATTGDRFFRNFGSNKYRLKLTDYE
jgi:hypothetical protein